MMWRFKLVAVIGVTFAFTGPLFWHSTTVNAAQRLPWEKLPNIGCGISVGGGVAGMLGRKRFSHGYELLRWKTDKWVSVGGQSVRVDTDADGSPWTVNDRNEI